MPVRCELGAHYAGGDRETVERLASFGRNLGIAFQIADDLLDLEGNESATGKSLGTDLAKRKMTLPLIHARDTLDDAERKAFLTALVADPATARDALLSFLTQQDSLTYARARPNSTPTVPWRSSTCLPTLQPKTPSPRCPTSPSRGGVSLRLAPPHVRRGPVSRRSGIRPRVDLHGAQPGVQIPQPSALGLGHLAQVGGRGRWSCTSSQRNIPLANRTWSGIRRFTIVTSVLLWVSVFAGPIVAQFVPLDLGNLLNTERDHIYGGNLLPMGRQKYDGVPFRLTYGKSYAWTPPDDANSHTLEIPVNVFGVHTVHTLLNTKWGQTGPKSLASIEFYGTGDTVHGVELMGGQDMRDYCRNDRSASSINGTTTVEVFNHNGGLPHDHDNRGFRLDKQRFVLPAKFQSDTLRMIKLLDSGAQDVQRLLFFGVTVEVPVPQAKQPVVDAALPLQGEYVFNLDGASAAKLGVQVVALGGNALRAIEFRGGLPGDGWNNSPRGTVDATIENGRVKFVRPRIRSPSPTTRRPSPRLTVARWARVAKSIGRARHWEQSRHQAARCSSTVRPTIISRMADWLTTVRCWQVRRATIISATVGCTSSFWCHISRRQEGPNAVTAGFFFRVATRCRFSTPLAWARATAVVAHLAKISRRTST